MIISYLAFFVLAVVVFIFTVRLGLPLRLAVALAVFLIPSIVLTVLVFRIGDKPPPDAITVVPRPSASDKADSKDSGTSK